MPLSLRDRLFRNWPIKLTALVLSAVLWAVVTAEEPTTQIVPVALELGLPEGRALAGALPQVQALYAGSSRELFKLYGESPTINKLLPDTLQGSTFILELATSDLVTPPGADVNAVEVQPRLIQVQLDDAMERRVPVVSQVVVGADSGFAVVGRPRMVPESVTVRGPLAQVQRIRSIPTEAISLTGLRASTRRVVRLDGQSLGLAQAVPAAVDVVVEVGEITTRLLVGIPVVIRADRPGAWIADPPAVAVTVRGVTSRLALLTRDSVQAVALISGATTSELARVAVTAPSGISSVASPDSVTVRRRT